ncbi:hypothetical protein LTR53_016447 [Teratosphaeriaceae sp. CCFEE 6253]|nr:hypothetical protein LTR53_016447 [Teratosphaeriaceae sp. CCFEE 6253]
MDVAIPQGAYAASILVLVWSAFCLSASALLAYMLITNGERTNYITLISIVVSISSTASIVQQIYYACRWRAIKTVAWSKPRPVSMCLLSPTDRYRPDSILPCSRSNSFAGKSGKESQHRDNALTSRQYVSIVRLFMRDSEGDLDASRIPCAEEYHSITAMLILFWAFALAKGVHQLQLPRLAEWETKIAVTSKVVAILVPSLFIGISFIEPIMGNVNAFLALNTVLIMASFALGGLLMIVTSIQYIRSRRLFASIQASGSRVTADTSTVRSGGGILPPRIKVYKVLLLRFTIAFVILAAFEVTVVCFEFTRTQNADYLAQRPGPDFSTASAVSEILLFMPGVSASLIAFLVFGTTAHFRQRYRKSLACACCVRKRLRPSSLRRSPNGLDVWETLDSGGGPVDTYRCTVRAGDVESLELSRAGKGVRATDVEVPERQPGRYGQGGAGRLGRSDLDKPSQMLSISR